MQLVFEPLTRLEGIVRDHEIQQAIGALPRPERRLLKTQRPRSGLPTGRGHQQ
jgi:hypothetical protein